MRCSNKGVMESERDGYEQWPDQSLYWVSHFEAEETDFLVL